MLRDNTPVEDHLQTFGLLVKREDLSCPPPGPPFSKTRGVFAHVKSRPERVIGVLDTYHSQGGHAVAQACAALGKVCINYYPVRKADQFKALQAQQQEARALGAKLVSIQAGRSAILYHQAKKHLAENYRGFSGQYMMPNALKLPEMVTETASEVHRTFDTPQFNNWRDLPETVIVSISSGTIAAGVMRGLKSMRQTFPAYRPTVILHMGYARSHVAVLEYMQTKAGFSFTGWPMRIVDEGYGYGDVAKAGPDPLWPCNKFYDLKAFRWWMREGRETYGEALLWNIG